MYKKRSDEMRMVLKKKLSAGLCLLLMVCTVLGAVPRSGMEVQAAEENEFEIENGVLKKYNGSGGEVIIPDGVTSIGEEAFAGCKTIKSVVIPKNVTSIGWGAFQGCSGLENVTIPENVEIIEDYAFWSCGLTSIEIPSSVTSMGSYPFGACASLESIKVAEGNEKYNSQGNCNAIIETQNNKLIAGCKNTIIPSSVTTIGNTAFGGCDELITINIPSSVTTIEPYAFFSCDRLKAIIIPEKVTSIEDGTFNLCYDLRSITIPATVTSIGKNTFADCKELTIYGEAGSYAETYARENNIKFSTGEMPEPGDLADMNIILDYVVCIYDGQAKKPAVTVKYGSSILKEDTDYTYTYQDNVNIGTAKVIVTGQGAYRGTVVVPFYITEGEQPAEKKALSDNSVILGQTSYVYDGQSKRPSITVKYGNTVLKENVDYTIAYQNNTNVGTAKVIVTGQGDYTGTVEKTFTITKPETKPNPQPETKPNPQPETKPNPQPAEKKALSAKNVTLSQTSYAYNGKARKPVVTVKDGKTVLKAGKDYTVSYQNNTNVGTAKVIVTGKGNYKGTVTKTFTITVKKNTSHKIGSYQYKVTGSSAVLLTAVKNSKVTKVKIPKTVKIGGKNFKVTAVGNNAFKKNKKIKTVEIGDNVKVIGAGAFEGCAKLGKVTVGKGVTEIGKNTLKDCKKLKDITVKSTKLKKVGKNALKGIKSNAKIKVPAKKLSEYQKLFKNKGQGKKVKIVK